MSCGGVVTDIFDVNNCVLAYNQCASTERVQVFLWQQIKKLQIFCNNLNETQGIFNEKTDADISANKQAIAKIQQQISTLELLTNSLSTNQTQLNSDVNAFKLSVDNTLRLYQTSINEITSQVDVLRSDNQALSNRVNVLESQTDLATLQEIIKTWQQINDKFSAELAANTAEIKQEFETFQKQIQNQIDSLKVDLTQQLNDNAVKQAATIGTILDTVNKNNAQVVTLTAQVTSLALAMQESEQKNEADHTAIRELIDTTAGNTEKAAAVYTDSEIKKVESRVTDAFTAYQASVNSQINDHFVKVNLLLDDMNAELGEYQRNFNLFKNQVEAQFITVNERIDTLTTRERENYELAYDAKRTANNALEIIVALQKSLVDFSTKQAEVEYQGTYNAENITRIMSPILKGTIINTADLCYQLYNTKLAITTPTEWTITPIAPFKLIDGENKVTETLAITEITGLAIKFQTINPTTGEMFETLFYPATETDTGVIVYPITATIGKAYINQVGNVACDAELVIPDIDFHPAPAPEPEPVPECNPMKIMIVDQNCEPVNLTPQPGRDGRDGLPGKDGAGVTDVQLEVKTESDNTPKE